MIKAKITDTFSIGDRQLQPHLAVPGLWNQKISL